MQEDTHDNTAPLTAVDEMYGTSPRPALDDAARGGVAARGAEEIEQ